MSSEPQGMEHDRSARRQWDAALLLRLLGLGLPHIHLIALGMIMLGISSAAAVAAPYLIKVALDDGIASGDTRKLYGTALLFLGVLVADAAGKFLQSYATQMLGQRVMYDLRRRLFAHVQRLSMSFFDRNPVGRIVTRLTNDVENLNQLFTEGIVAIFGDLILISGIVTCMLLLNRTLAFWTFTVLPFLVAATFVFRIKVRRAFDDVRFHLARINANIQENINGMSTVQLFLREGENFRIFSAINDDHRRANERTVHYFALFIPLVELISAVALAIVIVRGGAGVIAGTLTVGTVFAFIRYMEMFFRPVSDLADKFNILQSAVVSSERLFRLLDREPEVRDRPGAAPPARPVELIEFSNVTFGYDPAEPVIRNVSFTVERGRTVALVGHTGSGKTTLVSLLQRFYDVQEGAIRINGRDIRDFEQRALRGLMASVQQDPFLFTGTVSENLRLGEKEIDGERIRAAAALANARAFIEELPGKFESRLHEQGSNLSTGQKQLLSIARAMAFDPEILILDEATSSVDTVTESLIQAAIAELTRRRTSIVIAHRLPTTRGADRIIVMHRGRKVEEGNHAELVRRRGIYWRLYRMQYREEQIRGAIPPRA